jgi:dUTP pyrophosphatase
MKVRVKRIDKSLPLPVYETSGSVGFDLLTREDTIIPSKTLGFVPGNVIIETPPGYMLMLASRSSTPRKKGLLTPHGVGVVDVDYSGDEDELLIQVYNFSDSAVTVVKGEKLAQGVFVRVDKAEFQEVEKMNNESRGGFGSTDK